MAETFPVNFVMVAFLAKFSSVVAALKMSPILLLFK